MLRVLGVCPACRMSAFHPLRTFMVRGTLAVMSERLTILLAVPVLLANSPAPMSVEVFLVKAGELEARGPFARFSSDSRLLQREAQAAFEAWVQQARPPAACPPKGQRFRGDPKRFLAMMHAVPPSERPRISVREAFRRSWNARWPCR